MKKLFCLISAIFIAGHIIYFSNAKNVYADTCDTFQSDDEREQCRKCIDIDDPVEKEQCFEKASANIIREKQSLASEIQYMNTQVSLTQVRIQNSIARIAKTTDDIERLSGDISDLGLRIDKLKDSIDYQKKVFAARMRTRYKLNETSPLMVLFGSETINQLVQKSEYLQVMGIQDNKLLAEMDQTKTAFNKQKDVLQDKKEESESLKKRLETEKAQLDATKISLENQKIQRQHLLEVTQNDEKKYLDLIEEAKREIRQITGAVTVLKNTKGKEVKQGEVIGTQGNSGNSSGDHLHFGVYKYSSFTQIDGWNWYYSNYVDPSKKLKSKTVYWNTGCESSGNRTVGKGDWAWPLSSPTISQGYGHTCWSNVYYGGKDHPAYDMYSSYNAPVYAVDDGTAYSCRNCLGDGGNGVFIFHDDGYMTLYWHLR